MYEVPRTCACAHAPEVSEGPLVGGSLWDGPGVETRGSCLGSAVWGWRGLEAWLSPLGLDASISKMGITLPIEIIIQ